jgi:CheY-like chemotaxis protein
MQSPLLGGLISGPICRVNYMHLNNGTTASSQQEIGFTAPSNLTLGEYQTYVSGLPAAHANSIESMTAPVGQGVTAPSAENVTTLPVPPERPAAVLLDLRMPAMDGLTVLKQIRTINPRQPIIVLTGGTDHETEEQVRALGVTELVEKESAVHLLDDALKRVLAADVS